MGGLPRLRPKIQLLWVVTAVNAVYGEEHRRIAIFAIGHREAEFRMRHDNVAVVYQFNAKGHDTPHGHAANAAPFSTCRALRTTSSLIRFFDSRYFERNVKTATTSCSPPSPSPLLNSTYARSVRLLIGPPNPALQCQSDLARSGTRTVRVVERLLWSLPTMTLPLSHQKRDSHNCGGSQLATGT